MQLSSQLNLKRTEFMTKTVIEANAKNFSYWKDAWKYRRLAATLAMRDITVRYKQTIIGMGWSVISPIVNMLLMSFVFGSVIRRRGSIHCDGVCRSNTVDAFFA